MTSPAYEKFNPPIGIEVEHLLNKERRTVRCEGWNHQARTFDVTWPLCGSYVFDAGTGAGRGDAEFWLIRVESLRVLRRDPSFVPGRRLVRPAPSRPARRVGPALKAHPTQKELFQ